MIRLTLIVLLAVMSQRSLAESVYYSVNPNDPYSPAVKTSDPKPETCCYLTAPTMETKAIADKPARKQMPKPKLGIAEQRHQLKPLQVGGVLRNPRVKFNQADYQFKTLESRLSPSYKEKVFNNDAADQF